MAANAKKKKTQTFHAMMTVTRTEEWCVEAASAEEAKALLSAGDGHRCNPGELLHVAFGRLYDEN
jgi:hypothetical protein